MNTFRRTFLLGLPSLAGLGALVVPAAMGLAIPPAHAANIITFGDHAGTCTNGGAVLCSSDGTTGYLDNGTGGAFDLTTIKSWFQIDADGVNHLPATQTMAEPKGGAGAFLVVNDTGAAVTSFSLTLYDNFDSSTASVGHCSGSSGPLCDNFQAHGGSDYAFNTELSGPNWVKCTQGTTVGMTCMGAAGGVAADFNNNFPQEVTYTWTTTPGVSIAAGATFDITFASFNNDVWAPGPTAGAGLPGLALASIGLFGWWRRRRRAHA